jgi:hypothetical protein
MYSDIDHEEKCSEESISLLEHKASKLAYKVLIVSEKRDIRDAIRKDVEKNTEFSSILSADSIKESMEIIDKNKIQLVISDYRFSTCARDGYDLFKFCKVFGVPFYIFDHNYSATEMKNLKIAGVKILDRFSNIPKICVECYVNYLTALIAKLS